MENISVPVLKAILDMQEYDQYQNAQETIHFHV